MIKKEDMKTVSKEKWSNLEKRVKKNIQVKNTQLDKTLETSFPNFSCNNKTQ